MNAIDFAAIALTAAVTDVSGGFVEALVGVGTGEGTTHLCCVTLALDSRQEATTWGGDPRVWCDDLAALGEDISEAAYWIADAVTWQMRQEGTRK